MNKLSLIIFLLILNFKICAETIATPTSDQFMEPKLSDPVTNIPRTLKGAWSESFNTKSSTLWAWGGILASSTILYIYDEKIYKHSKELGRKLGIGNDDHTKTLISISDVNVFRGPTDVGSAMYFIGDGWMQTFTAAAFAITGSYNNDNRAKQTGSQIMTSLFSGTLPIQVLKRAAGREDPNRTTRYRGRWRPFNKNYDNDVSAYDAVPSGHMMAATSTLTVIDTNYPEYRSIIRPVGFTLLTLLAFQMNNNGVHWVSDYPLGMGIGYVVAKAATTYGRKSEGEKKPDLTSFCDWQVLPLFSSNQKDRTLGALATFDF